MSAAGHRLFLVRHGETDWNVAGRLQGGRDVPLNALGRLQAAQAGRVLQQLAGDVRSLGFVSSPLSRAVETMRILRTTLELPVTTFDLDPRLVEISFGRWEGQTWPELRRRDPLGIRKREADPWGFCPPGGESYDDLAARVGAALDALAGDTVVVTHGGVIRAVLSARTGMPQREAAMLRVRQGAVYVIGEAGFAIAD